MKAKRSSGARAYAEYLKSDHWRELRKWAITVLGNRCALTGAYLTSGRINVHHVRYPANWIDSRVADLVILSRNSHRLLHFYQKNGMINAFDEQGIRIARGLLMDGKGHRVLVRLVLREIPRTRTYDTTG
jgi:hypothetical protein